MAAPRKYPQELRDWAMRLVLEARREDSELSLNAAVVRIGQRVGVNPDTLRGWCKQAEIDAGQRPGTTTTDATRIKALEAEVRELKRANEFLLAPRRQDRRWALAWSPEQIAHRLPIDFPDDESMRISHEAIYQALYIQSRGALKRELVACLRTGRALRVPRSRARAKPGAHVSAEVMISERPAEVEDRAIPGHWEGDLIIGLERSVIGTVVERATRFTMLVHLPREVGYGLVARVKNGPALGGYGAVSMKNALAATMTSMPEQLRRSLTWDRGKELSAHAAFSVETGISVYFADPHSPWQRGTNENTNGLLRQYFPKGTDLSRWSADDLAAVADALNSRPRKTLGWKTPAEAMNEHLLLLEQAGVATTG